MLKNIFFYVIKHIAYYCFFAQNSRTLQYQKHKRYKVMESYYDDYFKGVEDCKNGIYDKWYRYNHSYDGYAYNDGWCAQNTITQNDSVRFIEYAL